MGRGGKKKSKKEDKEEKQDLGLDSLSIADSQPSTSQVVVTPAESKPVEGAEPAAEQEEEFVGLGLGDSKKKRKKKKPATQANQEQSQSSSVQSAQQSAPRQIASAPVQQPLPPPPASTPIQPSVAQWGRPTQPPQGQQTGPSYGHPQAPPPAFQPQTGMPTAGFQPQPRMPPPEFQPQPALAQSGVPPRGTSPVQPWGKTQGQPMGQQTSPMAPAWGQPQQGAPPGQSMGRGRGAGRGMETGPRRQVGGHQQAVLQPQQGSSHEITSSPVTQQTTSRQTTPPQATPPQQSAPPQRQGSTPPSNIVCRFRIPDKIIPRTSTVQSRRIHVLTNYLEMSIKPLEIHRYDVAIKPERPKKLLPKVFQMAKAKHFPKNPTAFDQRKNCYALKIIGKSILDKLTTTVETLDDNGAKMTFEVAFKHTGIVNLQTILNHMQTGGSSLNTPMEAIQCVDVILQQGTLDQYVKAGRQYFRRPLKPLDLGQGLEMWTGLFQSAIFTSRPFINIDVAHKGFPRAQPLLDALVRDFGLDPSRPLDRQRGVDQFNMFLRGLRVTALIAGTTRKREYICNSMVDPPKKLMFNMDDAATGKKQRMSVDKYFELEKKCRLRYPDLNCLWVGPRDKTIYYPIELLAIVPGQALNKQLSDKQQPIMVREAATAPDIRMKKIYECKAEMKYSTNQQFKDFGLTIADEFTKVDARILRPPQLNIGSDRPIEPRRGVWQTNGFVKASALQSWGLILVEANENNCQVHNMIDLIMKTGRRLGMAVSQPIYTNFNVRMQDLNRTLYAAVDKKVNFLFIIVSGRDKDCYHKVKRMAELEVGILTQCIKEFTASRRMNEQTMRNILLKVNSKLMGVNQVLDARSIPNCIREGGVMIIGADVTHPSPDQSNIPSIAAVTASIDPKCFMYNIEMSIQTPKKEMIMQFEDMVVDHLKIYKSHNNSLPKKLYVFRDGVSEGQFAEVMNSEIVALQRAYQRMAGPNAKPEILFLLVQKRHHTRFFSLDSTPQNVEPGTVVDTVIVHPRELDFYLVSHQAIKGTARPTRYHAVCNDGGVPADEVEQLAYYLCHLYARCTRSVSYPTPTYYAHLACLRARSLTFGDQFNNVDLERSPKRLHVLEKMLQTSRMFFV